MKLKFKFKLPSLKLNIDWLKLKYKVKAFFVFIPQLGIRNKRTSKVFDAWLWDRLKSHRPECISEYTCLIDGRTIWIQNYPYASGHLNELGKPELYCSRATAVRLGDVLKPHLDAIKAEGERIKREEEEALKAEFKVKP
jgi:hypothetical protein